MLFSLLLALATTPAMAQEEGGGGPLTGPKKASGGQTEVGNTKNIGIGFQAGYPVTFTAKYHTSQKTGISAHVG